MPDKAIFLDRDDTIIEDPGYINSAEQVKLVPAAAQALVELRKLGFKLIVVSNQSGIARGIIQEQAIGQIHDRLKQLLAEHNAYLDRIYFCPFHPDGAVQKFRKDSDWRKPKPGMLLAASKEMKISLADSWMIGNGYADIAAGKAAGCRTVLIKSNIKPPEKKTRRPRPQFRGNKYARSGQCSQKRNYTKARSPADANNTTARNSAVAVPCSCPCPSRADNNR